VGDDDNGRRSRFPLARWIVGRRRRIRRVAGALALSRVYLMSAALLASADWRNSIYMTTANTTIPSPRPGRTARAGDGHLQPHLEHDAGRRDGQRDRRQFRGRRRSAVAIGGRSWPRSPMLVALRSPTVPVGDVKDVTFGPGQAPSSGRFSPSGYQWVMLALVCGSMLVGDGEPLSRPLVTIIGADLGLTTPNWGTGDGRLAADLYAVAFLAGTTIDRIGLRKSLGIGILFIGLSALLRGMATGFRDDVRVRGGCSVWVGL